jgi:hypothetical protein
MSLKGVYYSYELRNHAFGFKLLYLFLIYSKPC